MKAIPSRGTIVIMPDLPLSQVIIIVYIIALVIGLVVLSLYAQKQSGELKNTKNRLASESTHLSVARQELQYAQKRLEEGRKTGDAETVLTQIRDAVLFINTQGSITVFTPQAEALFGVDKLSAVLKPYGDVITITDRDGTDISSMIGKSLSGEQVTIPPWSMLRQPNGSIPITGSATPVKTPGGATEFVVVLLHDATREYSDVSAIMTQADDLKNRLVAAESKLVAEQAFSKLSKRLIVEMKTGIIGIQADDKVTVMNKHAEQFTGMLADSVIGQQFRHLFRLTNMKDEEDFSAIDRALHGEPVPLTKWTFLTKRGGKGAVTGTVIPTAEDGAERSAVLVFHDAEREYEEEAEEKAFFSGAAHDLRSPLTTIRSVIELLSDSYETIDPQQAKELLMGAKDSVVHLIALVNDLLNVSRIEMGRITYSREQFDIVALTAEVIASQEVAAKQKHLYITHEITGFEMPKASADKTKTEEVLINLLSNAIKYTQQGGITVKHNFRDGKILTYVEDTGAGIAPENRRLLFKKFQQVGQSRLQPATKSTGLGLYIAKKFSTMMGGDIELADSTIGKGSTFMLSLPAAHG